MATTARDIIERAYRKIGVVAVDEPMTADQGANGLDALNMMLHGWEVYGINIGHSDMTLASDFTVPVQFHEGVVYMLAQRLAPDMQVRGVDADEWLRLIRSYYKANFENAPVAELPSALLNTSSQRRWTR
jgi:hypothetical protein